jgi:hypothetical protein
MKDNGRAVFLMAMAESFMTMDQFMKDAFVEE